MSDLKEIYAKLKPPKYKDKKYLDYIRSLPCPFCQQRAEPHHVRRHCWGAGTGTKPHDFVAVPRCRIHHDPYYEDGVELEIIELLMRYIYENKS